MSLIITILVLSIMKLTYTIGQFIAMRRLKLPVDKFVVGIEWGKPIFSKKFDETELVVYPLFWGGFLENKEVTDKKQQKYIKSCAWFMMLVSVALMILLSIDYIPTEVLSALIESRTHSAPFNLHAFWHNCASLTVMILLISILVLVHEAGHFLAARTFKMKVERFGFGLPFGPTLWQKKIGDTLVVVHACLLGGYVSFPDDDKENGLPKDSPELFNNKPIYQRFIVISAGVVANIICAIVFVFFTALLWGKLPTENYITYVDKIYNTKNISLVNSGLQSGDKLVEVNGSPADLQWTLQAYAVKSKSLDGKISEITASKNLEALKKLNGNLDENDTLEKGMKIKLPKATLEEPLHFSYDVLRGFEKPKEDKFDLTESQILLRNELKNKNIYEADGYTTLKDIAYAMSDNASPIYITVERNGEIIKLPPVFSDINGSIGVLLKPERVYKETEGFVSALKNSNEYLIRQTYLLLKGLWQLSSGKIPMDNVHGIVAVVKYGGDVIQHNGIFHGLLLTALISLNLAIINFLPIPALDGGHAMFLIIEKIYGKKLDEETMNTIVTFFFIFLILLMILLVYRDIVDLILHKI